MTVKLNGRIDSNNAPQVEQELMTALAGAADEEVVLDAAALEYISSAGLRVILRIKKRHPALRITNVTSEVYEILEMTGFTELLTVEKAYRVVSIEGCEEIGRGGNGAIYRIDQDNVVKVYNNADALDDIRHEREVAKLALVLGIPTAISYDVVRVGESYGSVFELLNARSFSQILRDEPEKLDWCVGEYVRILKQIHGTVVPAGKLPDMKETAVSWARFLLGHLPQEAGQKLLSLIEAIPHDDHMIHGDYHTKNLELQGDEVLLIDMDTLAVGHPIFELASMYNAFAGFSELDHEQFRRFQGFDRETAQEFWHKALAAYLGTDSEERIREVENKARLVGYTRLVRRSIHRGETETEKGRREYEHWRAELLELLDDTDSLLFLRNEMETEAAAERLDEVQAFVDAHLEAADCPLRTQMQIDLVVEEVFVNIASYAYAPGKGSATVRAETTASPRGVVLTFFDSGTPYDPLAREDPDITLSAEERQIGGLGIFITKKTMDEVRYEYRGGQNILTMRKNF